MADSEAVGFSTAATGSKAMSAERVDLESFVDWVVLYRSADSRERFVAHSIKTDQIGMGHSAEDALRELFAALCDVITEYNHSPETIELWKPAPQEIVDKFVRGRRLPGFVFERARRQFRPPAYGSQAQTWTPDEGETNEDSFAALDLREGTSMAGEITAEMLFLEDNGQLTLETVR